MDPTPKKIHIAEVREKQTDCWLSIPPQSESKKPKYGWRVVHPLTNCSPPQQQQDLTASPQVKRGETSSSENDYKKPNVGRRLKKSHSGYQE